MVSWKGNTTVKSPGETVISPVYDDDRIFHYGIISNTGTTKCIVNLFLVYGSYSILIAPKNIELNAGALPDSDSDSWETPYELILKKGEQFKIVAAGSTIDYYFISKD